MSDGTFYVKRSYFMAARDLVVLVGATLEQPVAAEMWLCLPSGLQGPPQVPLLSVESVRFADGREEVCLTIACHHLERYPMFEPVTLEGQRLRVRPR